MKPNDFIPPVVSSALKHFHPRYRRPVFRCYAEALAACTKDGYENDGIVDVVVRKTLIYRDKLRDGGAGAAHLSATDACSLVALLVATGSPEMNVLDFGGAAGAHYFLARSLVPAALRINWFVVETPAMARAAAAAFSDDELRFFPCLADAAKAMPRIDVLHTSGTIQCVDRHYDHLRQLVSLSAAWIFFNRLGLAEGDEDIFTLRESMLSWHGPGGMPAGIQDRKACYPLVFPARKRFMPILSDSYEIVHSFDDDSGSLLIPGKPVTGLGLLLRRKNSQG